MADLCIHLVEFLRPISKVFVLKVRVVGEGSPCAQLHLGKIKRVKRGKKRGQKLVKKRVKVATRIKNSFTPASNCIEPEKASSGWEFCWIHCIKSTVSGS